MATRIKSNQIADNSIVAADLHSAIAVNTTASGTFGSVIVDNYTLGSNRISTNQANSYNGDIMLDAAGKIILDTDVGNVQFKDNGQTYAEMERSSGNVILYGAEQDKNIEFKGNVGGTATTGLTLDFANSGRATFNENVSVGGDLTVTGNIDGNVVITGDLTVEGTQVTLETTALDVEDKNITLNYHASNDTSASADGAGITIQDAVNASTDASILWDSTNTKFDFSHAIDITGTATMDGLTVDGATLLDNGANATHLTLTGTTGRGLEISTATNSYTDNTAVLNAKHSQGIISLQTASVERLHINKAGNIGFGETPNPNWSASYRAIDAFGGATLQFEANSTRQGQNFYGYPWKYKATRTASSIAHTSVGDISFQVAPSGTADAAITWSQAMLIKNGGNVGIGTDSPSATLEITSQIGDNGGGASTVDYPLVISQEDVGNTIDQGIGAGVGILFKNATNSSSEIGSAIASMRASGSDGNTSNELAFFISDNDTTLDEAVRIDVNGHVGIGTPSPSYPLHISGTGSQRLKIEKTDAGGDADVQLSSKDDSTQWILFHDRDSGNNSGVIKYVHSTNKMHFRTNDVDDRLVISDDGNVGIGITSPGNTLHITSAGHNAYSSTVTKGSNHTGLSIVQEGGNTDMTGVFFGSGGSGSGSHWSAITGSRTAHASHWGTQLNFYTHANDTANLLDATQKMIITGDGNVGISTDDPKRPLQIGATGSFPISFNGNYPDIHMNTYYESGWRIHTAGFGAKTTFNGATGAFGFSNVASTQNAGASFTPIERLTILANGNVGIGTDTPVHNLDVEGAIATRQVRHNITPSLHFDFANSESLDSRIHFKRQSIASYVDKNGFIAYAAENEPRFDHDPVTKESRGLLIEGLVSNVCNGDNKGLSLNYNAMSHIRNEGLAPDGTFSATRVIATGGTQRHEVNLAYSGVSGTLYTGSVYVKPLGNVTHLAMSQAGGTQLIIFDLINGTAGTPGGGAAGAISDAGNGWKRVQLTYTESTTSTTRAVYMSPGIGAGGSSVYNNLPANGENGVMLWGAQVEFLGTASSYIPLDIGFTSRASRATYFDKYGIMQLAGSNQARNDHRWDGRNWRKCGRLYESASTNMTPDPIAGFYSGASAGTEINSRAELAPDGTYTAVRFSTTVSSGNRTFSNPGYIPVAANTVYTYSCYVKNISMTGWSISLPQHASTGTITIIKQRNTTISEMSTTEWKRMEITFKTGSNNGGVWVQDFRDGGTGSAILWGKQLEEGHEATSFIYEGTRAADVLIKEAGDRDIDIAYMDIEEYWNTEESTLFVESETNITDYTLHNYNATAAAFAPNEGRAQVRYDNTYGLQALGYVLTPSNTEIFTLSTNTFPKYSKAALSLKLNDYDLVANGGTPISDSAGIMPNPTKLHFGTYNDLGSASEPLYGVIKRVSYYDAKLDNSVMQALTEIN